MSESMFFVYLSEHNPNIYESEFLVNSVHKTLEGADAAMKSAIADANKNGTIMNWMQWRVRKMEVKP